ncbi:MAG: hypothetical protein K8S99_17140 [Planctomycetes bacterium]|nr:hypothetical protein [Planctomycetota bacterium]
MPVIKGYTAGGMMKEAVVLDLGDLGRQAARIQAATEVKARKIIADAELEASRLGDDARAKGHTEGRAEGLERGLKEGREQGRAEAFKQAEPQLKQLQEAWTATLRDWETQRDAIEREARQSIVDIALAVAEKLVHRIIEVDASVIVEQVAQTLTYILQPMDVTVRISPQDREVLEQAMPELQTEFSHLTSIRLIQDPNLSPGGCIVSYGQGQVDASINTQLSRLVELMLPGQTADAPPPVLEAEISEPPASGEAEPDTSDGDGTNPA